MGTLIKRHVKSFNGRLWVILPLIAVLAVACGAAEEPAAAPAAPAQQEAAPTATFAPQMIPQATSAPAAPAMADSSSGSGTQEQPQAQETAPTAAPAPTQAPPPAAVSAKDHAVVVTEAEPASIGMWSEGCSAEIHSMGCTDFVSDFLTWLDDRTAEIVPLSGVDSWEQKGLDRWQFNLREGVKFHNGAPWNAAAAKYGIEYNAFPANPSASISWTGPDMTGEVINDLTFQAVCPNPCPIYPRTALFSDFQDPEWFENATEEEKALNSIGFGPYKIIGYTPGVSTEFEIYEDYLPNENWFSQAPSIQYITHTYRAEAPVRSAMIQAGEANWAADIGFEEVDNVVNSGGKTVSGKTAEVYTLVFDTVFHEELAKQKVRLALTHAIDCQTMLDSFFGGRIPCHNAISMKGTVGITDENSKWREYNPELARQLLAEAGYDPENEININTRPGSNIRGLELMEATIQFWRDVGVNANLNSHGDLGAAREIQNSGCGQFTNTEMYGEGYRAAMDCGDRDPPGPAHVSSHAYEIATSNEILDMQRFNNSRLSCFSRSSRHCTAEFEAWKTEANSIPEGPERTAAMEAIADFSHEQAIFLPFFEVVYVYGLSGDIEWQPYYAPRLRGNTMRFTE